MLFIFLIGQSPQMSICTIASIFGIFIFPESNTLVISIIPCPFSLIINGVNCYVFFHHNSFRFRHRVNALGGGGVQQSKVLHKRPLAVHIRGYTDNFH